MEVGGGESLICGIMGLLTEKDGQADKVQTKVFVYFFILHKTSFGSSSDNNALRPKTSFVRKIYCGATIRPRLHEYARG